MTKIWTNPNAMLIFAKQLDQFSKDLTDRSKELRAAFNKLGQEWKGQEYSRFKNEFQALIKHVDTYLRDAEALSRLITEKALAYIDAQKI